MNTPHDTDGSPGPEQVDDGPRVSRDEVRDLARLRRSRTDRKVAGVAAGVARHLDIDPLLVRIAFVVLTFFGGGGLILYGVAWVLVPEEDTGDAVIRVDDGVRVAALVVGGIIAIGSMIGDSVGGPGFPWPLMVIGLVLLVVLGAKQAISPSGSTHPWLRGEVPASDAGTQPAGQSGPSYPGYRPGPPPPPAKPVDPKRRGPVLFPFTFALAALATGVVGTLHLAGVDVAPSVYPATVLGVVGLMLVVGAFYGRAGGLIFVGLLAAAATAITSVTSGLDIGEIRQRPDTAADLAPSYDLDVGDILIDLTRLDDAELAKLDGKSLDLDLNVGHIRVVVPDDGLRVEADATVELGEIVLFGDKSGNSDKGVHGDPDDPDEPVLTVDADMVIGQIEVLTEKEAA